MGTIKKVFCDVKCLVDLYIYHDSQVTVESSKLFEKMVSCVCKVVNDSQGSEYSVIPIAGSLKMQAIESLGDLLRQLVKGLPNNEELARDASECKKDAVKAAETETNFEDSDFVCELISLVLSISWSSFNVSAMDSTFQQFAQRMFESNCFSE
jgi:hypothetical protein